MATQRIERAHDTGDFVEQGRLVDFEDEAVRLDAGRLQSRHRALDETGVSELAGGDIDVQCATTLDGTERIE